jgi:DnaK suppressor protein
MVTCGGVNASVPATKRITSEATVTSNSPRLDPAFIERQRQALLKLRAALLSAAQDEQADAEAVKSESAGGPREYEDDAQKLAMLELDSNRVARDLARVARIDRALKKIEEGTYGLSDMSGQPIPRERLEAVPESIYTLAEERALEQKR